MPEGTSNDLDLRVALLGFRSFNMSDADELPQKLSTSKDRKDPLMFSLLKANKMGKAKQKQVAARCEE
eukprot:1094944-Pyramimonas_sp.AAC.1